MLSGPCPHQLCSLCTLSEDKIGVRMYSCHLIQPEITEDDSSLLKSWCSLDTDLSLGKEAKL